MFTCLPTNGIPGQRNFGNYLPSGISTMPASGALHMPQFVFPFYATPTTQFLYPPQHVAGAGINYASCSFQNPNGYDLLRDGRLNINKIPPTTLNLSFQAAKSNFANVLPAPNQNCNVFRKNTYSNFQTEENKPRIIGTINPIVSGDLKPFNIQSSLISSHNTRPSVKRVRSDTFTNNNESSADDDVMGTFEKNLNFQSNNEESDTETKRRNIPLRFGRKVKRRRAEPVPADLKDDTYWSRRKKNNTSARKSRELRSAKEAMLVEQLERLEDENYEIKEKIAEFLRDIEKLKNVLGDDVMCIG